MEYAISRFPQNGNQNTTHKSNYTMETMSKINYIDELPEFMFTINFKIINQYQRKYPSLTDKHKRATYKWSYFCGGRNRNFKL